MSTEMKYSLYVSIIAFLVNELLGYNEVYPLLSMAMKGIFLIFTFLFTYFLIKFLTRTEVSEVEAQE